MQYKEQIERIKDKIPLACKADAGNEVFGASSHKYKIGPTLSESEISEFEKQYSISLPNCYRSFLLHVGNGGSSYFNSSAGHLLTRRRHCFT